MNVSRSIADVAQKDRSLWQISYVRRLFHDLAESLRNPEFWTLSAWLDIVVTYRRSRLGALWLLAPSIVYAWGVGLLFGGLFGIDIFKYVSYVGMGFMIFGVMSSTITQSTHVLFQARSFIMDGRMRLTDFVLRCLAKSVFHFLVAIPAVALALILYLPGFHPLGFLTGLGGLALIVIDTFFIGVIFALIGARFPDVQELVGNLMRVMVFLTPIIWLPSQMPPESLRGQLARINPFFHMLQVVRSPILGEPVGMYSWYYVGILTVVSAVLAVFLYRRYARLVPIWL